MGNPGVLRTPRVQCKTLVFALYRVTDFVVCRGAFPLVCITEKEYNEYGNSYADKRRRRRMELIILLCIPLVPAIIVTIYAVVTNKKRPKHTEPETA